MSKYGIAIIELSKDAYFWVLKKEGEVVARSKNIDKKDLIETEADEIGKDFELPVFVEER